MKLKTIKNIVAKTTIATALSTSLYATDCSYELFTISSTRDTKIIDFIEQLSDECEFSLIITDPNTQKYLQKPINKTHIKNLTLQEVLDIILKGNNLTYKLEDNVLKISFLITKTFEIDYTTSKRKGKGSTDITLSSQVSNQLNNTLGGGVGASAATTGTSGSTGAGGFGSGSGANTQSGIKIESTDEVMFWETLQSELENILNRPEDAYKAPSPVIDKDAGLVTVTATQSQMNRIENYIKKLQKRMQSQVLIDVQILAVTMQKGKSTGIDWQQIYALQNFTVETNIAKGTITDESGNQYNPTNYITLKGGATIKELIKFLQSQGDVTAISNPKVLTLNNQPALITVGTEYFYKIQQSTNQQGSTGGIVATTQNDAVQSVFAGVLLDITPQISSDNTITLKINPSLSETAQDLSLESSENRTMPPDLNRRQLSSVVTVKDGNRIVLGGLINTKKTKNTSKVPILGDIPGIDYFFKREENIKVVQELVIVIEPHIIKKDKNKISLKDLGYTGIDDAVLKSNTTSSITHQSSDEDGK